MTPARPTDAARAGRRRRQRRLTLLAVYLCTLAVAVAWLAATFRHPTDAPAGPAPLAGRTVLTVFQGDREVRRFDLAALEALRPVTHRLETPWYPRRVALQGPLLRDVLAAAGASGRRISAVAVNDYAVEIPFTDATTLDAIVALRIDGKPLSPRDRGPLFLVYPYDRLPPAQRPQYHAVSVWQLDVLRVY